MVKDSKKYATTDGWGFAQFQDGKPADEAVHQHMLPLPSAFQSSGPRLHPLCTLTVTGAPAWDCARALAGELGVLMDRPKAGCREFEKVAIRVAEIDAFPAARPVHAAFDRNTVRIQAFFPSAKFLGADGEGAMQRPSAVVTRNHAARHCHGLDRRTPLENKKDAPASDFIGGQPAV